jgi:DNA-binding NarL/FixJ family response regulator
MGSITTRMKTAVVADDHQIVRQMVRRILEKELELRVVGEAADGLEATRLVSDSRPDILVTDLRMPGADGTEVARQVRGSSPETKIVIYTVYDDPCFIYGALEVGANGYVLKKSSPDNLINAIKEVISDRKYLDPAISKTAVKSYQQKANKPPLFLET